MHKGLTPLTFPFQLVVWFWVLNTQVWGTNFIPNLTPSLVVLHVNATSYDAGRVALAVFSGVAEIFVLADWWSGVIILVGMLVCSPISAAFCYGGSLIGTLYAMTVGIDANTVYLGLYGYNSSLCTIALGGFFLVMTGWRMVTHVVLFGL